MLCSFLLGTSSGEDSEDVAMFCNLGGISCEISCNNMHDIFGFHNSDVIVRYVPENFNPFEAWLELTGCNNFVVSGTPSVFIRDDSLLMLHRILAFNVSGKIDGSKVNGTECYLLWAAKNDVQVSISHFI